jgi:ferredoxin
MEEDISKEIEKIVSYCRARECVECKFLVTEEICALHNPSMWEV